MQLHYKVLVPTTVAFEAHIGKILRTTLIAWGALPRVRAC